ncbi:MAG: hypothetical protein ACT4PP_13005 [Sporichthyaceae bacterium]
MSASENRSLPPAAPAEPDPRSLEQVLADEDDWELSRRFEQWEPEPGSWRDARPLARIYAARTKRREADDELTQAVIDARAAESSWWLIGSYLGTTAEAARQRFGAAVEGAGLPARVPPRRRTRPPAASEG